MLFRLFCRPRLFGSVRCHLWLMRTPVGVKSDECSPPGAWCSPFRSVFNGVHSTSHSQYLPQDVCLVVRHSHPLHQERWHRCCLQNVTFVWFPRGSMSSSSLDGRHVNRTMSGVGKPFLLSLDAGNQSDSNKIVPFGYPYLWYPGYP